MTLWSGERHTWTAQGVRPVVTVTGSHQKTCVFGTLTIDGRQLFRQYDMFDQYAFIDRLPEAAEKEVWKGSPVYRQGTPAPVKEGAGVP